MTPFDTSTAVAFKLLTGGALLLVVLGLAFALILVLAFGTQRHAPEASFGTVCAVGAHYKMYQQNPSAPFVPLEHKGK